MHGSEDVMLTCRVAVSSHFSVKASLSGLAEDPRGHESGRLGETG